MFSKGKLSKIIQSTQEIYLETNVNNVHNSSTNMDNIILSRRNGRNFNYYLILMSIDNHAAWRA